MNRTATIIIAALATLTGCAQEPDATDGRRIGATGFAGITRSQPVGGMDYADPEEQERAEQAAREEAEQAATKAAEDADREAGQTEEGGGEATPEADREAGQTEDDGGEVSPEADPSGEPQDPQPQEERGNDDKVADLPVGAWTLYVNDVYDISGAAQMEPDTELMVSITEVDGVPMLLGMAPIYASEEMLSVEQVDISTSAPEDGHCKIITRLLGEGVQTGPEQFDMTVYFEDTVVGEDCAKLGYGDEKSETVEFSGSFEYAGASMPADPQPEEGDQDAPNH